MLKASQVVLSGIHPNSCPCPPDLRSTPLCESHSSNLPGEISTHPVGNHPDPWGLCVHWPISLTQQRLSPSLEIRDGIRFRCYSWRITNDLWFPDSCRKSASEGRWGVLVFQVQSFPRSDSVSYRDEFFVSYFSQVIVYMYVHMNTLAQMHAWSHTHTSATDKYWFSGKGQSKVIGEWEIFFYPIPMCLLARFLSSSGLSMLN